MKTLVVYESMFGNTRRCAEAIASGLATNSETALVAVGEVAPDDLLDIDLLVVGGPTHAWGLSRPNTREGAATQAKQPSRHLSLEPGATGYGLREWLAEPGVIALHSAVFATRSQLPRLVTGSAGPKIARGLRRRGCDLVCAPMSFLVTKANELVAGEEARAMTWGSQLGDTAQKAVRF